MRIPEENKFPLKHVTTRDEYGNELCCVVSRGMPLQDVKLPLDYVIPSRGMQFYSGTH